MTVAECIVKQLFPFLEFHDSKFDTSEGLAPYNHLIEKVRSVAD